MHAVVERCGVPEDGRREPESGLRSVSTQGGGSHKDRGPARFRKGCERVRGGCVAGCAADFRSETGRCWAFRGGHRRAPRTRSNGQRVERERQRPRHKRPQDRAAALFLNVQTAEKSGSQARRAAIRGPCKAETPAEAGYVVRLAQRPCAARTRPPLGSRRATAAPHPGKSLCGHERCGAGTFDDVGKRAASSSPRMLRGRRGAR